MRRLLAHLKGSTLAQAGFVLVLLGGGVEALDTLGTVDLSSLPYVGHYAPAILAMAGVAKIILRLAIALITGFSTVQQSQEASQ